MPKNQRVVNNDSLNSGLDIVSILYNPASGAQKSLIVGPRYLPVQVAGGWTTNAAAGLILPQLGMILAVYNNSGSAASITTGPSTVTALAIGATDAFGNVGVACPPNAWTYVSMGNNQYVFTSAATLLVYTMEDPTRLVQETGAFINQKPLPSFVPPVNS